MARWALGPDELRHLYERAGINSSSVNSACGLPEVGRSGEGDGDGRCVACVGLERLMGGHKNPEGRGL